MVTPVASSSSRSDARPARLDDVDEVVRLAAVMITSTGQDATGADWVAAARESFTSRLGADLGVFVVDAPDHPGLSASGAGTISTRLPVPKNISARTGYVQWIATDADARRRGYSRAVMQALLDWFAERDVPVIELHSTPDGEPLYRELGFNDEGPIALRRRSI